MGQKRPSFKLEASKRERVVSMLRAGTRYVEIACEVGVSEGTIANVARAEGLLRGRGAGSCVPPAGTTSADEGMRRRLRRAARSAAGALEAAAVAVRTSAMAGTVDPKAVAALATGLDIALKHERLLAGRPTSIGGTAPAALPRPPAEQVMVDELARRGVALSGTETSVELENIIRVTAMRVVDGGKAAGA